MSGICFTGAAFEPWAIRFALLQCLTEVDLPDADELAGAGNPKPEEHLTVQIWLHSGVLVCGEDLLPMLKLLSKGRPRAIDFS